MDVVLFGIQGSGKGTQARKLCEDYGYQLFETGAELRRIAASGSEIGNTIASYIDKGNLAPHEIVMEVLREAIKSKDQSRPILFDGIPRDETQKQDFDVIMKECNRSFTCIELKVNEELAVERVLNRREQGRADDADESFIRRRMGIFHEKTVPVIEAYRSQGHVQDVDGEGTIDEVYSRLKAAIGHA